MRDRYIDYEASQIDNADPGQGLFAASLVVGTAALLVVGALCGACYVMLAGVL